MIIFDSAYMLIYFILAYMIIMKYVKPRHKKILTVVKV